MNSFTRMQLLAALATSTVLFAAGCDQQNRDSTSAATPSTADKMANATNKAADKMANATQKAGDKVDDAAITAKVKTALMAEPGLKSLEINVDTRDNIVTLAGTVASPDLKQKATQIAQAVEGVKQVSDQLVVKPS